MQKIVTPLVVILVLAGIIGAAVIQQRSKPANLYEVKKGDISDEVLANGRVRDGQIIDITPQVEGRVVALRAVLDSEVKVGDSLIEFEIDPKSVSKTDERALLIAEQARLAEIQKDFARDTQLLAQLSKTKSVAVTPNKSQPKVPQTQPVIVPIAGKVDFEKQKKDAQIALERAKNAATNDLTKAYAPVPDLLEMSQLRAFRATGDYSQELFFGTMSWLSFPSQYSNLPSELQHSRAIALDALNSIQAMRQVNAQSNQNGIGFDNALKIVLGNLYSIRDYLSRLIAAIDVANNVASESNAYYKNKVLWARVNIEDVINQIPVRQDAIVAQKHANDLSVAQAQWFVDYVLREELKYATEGGSASSAVVPASVTQKPGAVSVAPLVSATAQIVVLEQRIEQGKLLINLQKARIAATQTRVESLKKFGNQSSIKSPIDGRISKLDIRVGDILVPGKSIISIGSIDQLALIVDVPGDAMKRIAVGNPVGIHFDAISGETLGGHVISIQPGQKDATGVETAGNAIVSFDKIDSRIAPDMTARVEVVTATKHGVIRIPESALRTDEKGSFVNTYENGKTSHVQVSVGARSSEGYVEIISGLSEGRQLVDEGKKK